MRRNDNWCPSVLEDVRRWPNKKLIEYFEGMSIPAHNQGRCVIQVLSERFRSMTNTAESEARTLSEPTPATGSAQIERATEHTSPSEPNVVEVE